MRLTSTNPSKNYLPIGSVEISTEADVASAVLKARKAFPVWSEMTLKKRCECIDSFLKVCKPRAEEIAQLIAAETGRPIKQSRANVTGGFEYFKAYMEMAEKYLAPETTFESEKEIHQIFREPRGVIAAITPWNYPFMNIAWQCGQALIAGNTIVYKSSEEDPLFSKLIAELMAESKMPEGVFNVIYGDGKVGDMLIHQNIDMISFTGSTATGMYLAKVAAEKMIPITAELGGSSPMIIFEDVEIIDEIIKYIFDRRFKVNGQACDAVKRLIVHKSKFNEVVKGLVKYAEQVKIGDASDESTEIGPLVSKRQLALIATQVKDAVEQGAKILTGGAQPKNLKGAYYLPTILTVINNKMRVWNEETFGPVLPIVKFVDEEYAVKLANDTEYGLTAHILTNDKARFERIAKQIKAGSIGQNQVGFWSPKNPFGGFKKSGIGRLHGEFGFNEVTQIKVVSGLK